jgi:hypothetical protein
MKIHSKLNNKNQLLDPMQAPTGSYEKGTTASGSGFVTQVTLSMKTYNFLKEFEGKLKQDMCEVLGEK